MKKFLLLSTVVVAAAIVFASCNKNELENTPCDSKRAVVFSSNIVKVSLPTTRMEGSNWAKNDSVGIFMLEENSTEVVEDMSNIKYTTQSEGEKGNFTAGDVSIFFPDNGNKVRFM